ncbi:hypothetical protein PENTCL1PPCAC_29042, partial [Pristionchus entomophagus]
SRFISQFSRIETCVLEDLTQGYYASLKVEDHVVDAVLKALGDVKINRLDVAQRYMDDDILKRTVELCRSHDVRTVLIQTTGFNMNNFREFVQQLIAMDITLDLYETSSLSKFLYHGKPKLFWERMVEEMSELHVSMQILTSDDAGFNQQDYGYRVRSHVRCKKTNATNAQPLTPVEVKRGFNLRSF